MTASPSTEQRLLDRIRDASAEVVAAADDIRILSVIAWPPEVVDRFLAGVRAGRRRLPEPPPPRPEVDDALPVMRRWAEPLGDHPAARYLARTAASYVAAGEMLQAAGTPAFGERSLALFGRPDDAVAPGGLTSLAAAHHFVARTDDLASVVHPSDDDYCLTADEAARRMRRDFDPVFGACALDVEVDPTLGAKASANALRVRLRAGTCFSENDVLQLTQHEGLVHSATARNGLAQTNLPILGLASPRITATQEGLATFAELITRVIDLNRLRRLALRVVAIDAGLRGADFLEVFDYLLDGGMTETEAAHSAARVFRGGDPRGGVVFAKDGVYLRGLLQVHTFFHAALAAGRPELARTMFLGKLTCGDALELAPLVASGVLRAPALVPPWATQQSTLAAYLAFSWLTHSLPMQHATLDDFTEPPD